VKQDIIPLLEQGFCLSVGAGLTIQITGNSAVTPDWKMFKCRKRTASADGALVLMNGALARGGTSSQAARLNI